jgi:hypothetical protein
MSNSFNNTENLGEFSENYSSNFTSPSANFANLSSQIISGGICYLEYDGTVGGALTADIHALTVIVKNTTDTDTLPLVITLPNGLVDGQLIFISPASEVSSYQLAGTNYYAYDFSHGFPTTLFSFSFTWSDKLQLWCPTCQY